MSHANTRSELWQFDALDSWFFRESRPLDAVGGAQLSSLFPPPARTVVGAVRTTLGEAANVDWQAFKRDPDHAVRRLIGSPQDPAPLSFVGPYLLKDGKRLYPAPLLLLGKKTSDPTPEPWVFTRLRPAEQAVACDLGRVRLPCKPKAKQGQTPVSLKPLESCWLTERGLNAVLAGGTPKSADVLQRTEVCTPEPRLGIALDERRRPQEGLLYQTQHLRMQEGVTVGMNVTGLNAQGWPGGPLAANGLTRLGGEGRLAAWQRSNAPALPAAAPLAKGERRLLMLLLTPAVLRQGWLPDGFAAVTTAAGHTEWHGLLYGRPARLVCAVLGKPVREGGWSLAEHQPSALRALVPAGSCYFLEFDKAEDAQKVRECHGAQIGDDTEWGHGQVAMGCW